MLANKRDSDGVTRVTGNSVMLALNNFAVAYAGKALGYGTPHPPEHHHAARDVGVVVQQASLPAARLAL